MADHLKQLGNGEYAKGNYLEAVELYQKALLQCSEEDAQIKSKEWTKSVEECDKGLAFNSSNQKALYRKAKSLEQNGSLPDWSSALKCYEDLLRLNHGHECASDYESLKKRTDERMQREKDEMLSKLKDIGNQFLGKFGMSTNDFKFTQGSDGNYSISSNK